MKITFEYYDCKSEQVVNSKTIEFDNLDNARKNLNKEQKNYSGTMISVYIKDECKFCMEGMIEAERTRYRNGCFYFLFGKGCPE